MIACEARRVEPLASRLETIVLISLTRRERACESFNKRDASRARASGVARC